MNKKKAGVIAGIVVLAAAVAAGVWYYKKNDGKDKNDKVYVQKVSAIMGTATGVQNRYSGVVQPQKTVDVNPDSERTVKEVYVKVGDEVEEGTPLFCYDVDEIEMDLQQAKLELENIDIEISNYKNQIAELQKEKDAAAEGDKFEYTTQIQTVQTSIRQSEFEKEGKKLEIEKIQKKMDNSEVKSKIAGVVKTLNDNEAAQEMGDSSAFLTILATGEYRVKGKINEQNAAMISPGANVIIRSRVDETMTWNGTINNIETGEPEEDEDEMMMGGEDDSMTSSSSYPFYVALENADGLMLGQHVLIELDEGQTEKKEGVWLYASYIVQDGENAAADGVSSEEISTEEKDENKRSEEAGGAFVWADDGNGKLVKKPVVLGEYDEALDEYEIKSGLEPSDLIAWVMPGLYEGIATVTNAEDVDYSSGLYNQESGTEEMFDEGTEMPMDEMFPEDGMSDTEMMIDEGFTRGVMPEEEVSE